jgi:L-iditol 2-dehydrogenase
MKAAVWRNNRDIRIETFPDPVPGENEALVKVLSSGICGSDVVEWYRLPRAPLVPGHEIGAQVVEVGASVKKIKPGDRVFIAPKAPCMECFHCRSGHHPACCQTHERLPGGLAEYILVPPSLIENGTYLLPDGVTYDQSVFIEPVACAARAWRLAGDRDFRSVMVIGCGMAGLIHIKLAKLKHIPAFASDMDPNRREKALEFGAEAAFDARENVAERLVEANGGKADLVILCASSVSAVAQAWECLENGGVLVFFAAPGPDERVDLPLNDLWTREVSLVTSYYCGPPDIAEAMRLIETGALYVDDMITHRLPLDETPKGFEHVVEGGKSIKVIIKPHGLITVSE